MSSSPGSSYPPGAYKFTVGSAGEAVTLIRERLGPQARVLSVRAVEASGLGKLFRSPRLEVIAQVDPDPAPVARGEAAIVSLAAVSEELAAPERRPPPSPSPARSRLAPLPSSLGLEGLLRRSGITETALLATFPAPTT